jgi:hypothetical protein
MADCGELVSEEEPAIDPDKVIVGQCGQDFPVSGTPGEQTSVRVIATNTNEQAVEATVIVRADGEPIGQERGAIAAGSNHQFDVTITIPPAGRYQVRAEAMDVTAVTGFHPRTGTSESVRAGAGPIENGEQNPVADGGVDARAALARACGGCAERSRKLSATNRRLRRSFDFIGG